MQTYFGGSIDALGATGCLFFWPFLFSLSVASVIPVVSVVPVYSDFRGVVVLVAVAQFYPENSVNTVVPVLPSSLSGFQWFWWCGSSVSHCSQ